MPRLHTNWSRSLLRDKPATNRANPKQEEGKVLLSVAGFDLLNSYHEAKKIPVTIPGLKYLYNEQNGKRILQRFYSSGGKIRVPGEDFDRDAVFEVEPRFAEGHILPFSKLHKGTLVVEVPETTNVYNLTYLQPENPAKSTVKVTFIINPDFVSFDGVKSVDPNAKDSNEDDESEEESEEG